MTWLYTGPSISYLNSTALGESEGGGGGGDFEAVDYFAFGAGTSGEAAFTVPAHSAGDTIVIMLSVAFNTLTLPASNTGGQFQPLAVGATPSDAQLAQSATVARLYRYVDTDNSIGAITFDWATGSAPWMVCGVILSGTAVVGDSETQITNGGMDRTLTATETGSIIVAWAARRTAGDHTLIASFTRQDGQDNTGTNGEAEIASYNNPVTVSDSVQCTWASGFSNNIFYLVEFVPA